MNQLRFVVTAFLVTAACADTTEEDAKKFIDEVYKKSGEFGTTFAEKRWAADTADKAHSKEAKKELDEASKKYVEYQKSVYKKVMSYPWKTFKDPDLKRKFFIESFLEEVALSDTKQTKLKAIQQEILNVNIRTLVKEYKSTNNKPKLTGYDVAQKVIKGPPNADEFTFYWKERHDKVGRAERNLFTQWLALETETAKLNGYDNLAAYWQAPYELSNFEYKMLQLYKQVEPLFKELHAYIRHKLWIVHGRNNSIIDLKKPIPASLLGDSWGIYASSLYDLLKPYPNEILDISPALKAKNFTGSKMAQIAENYFVEMGLSKLSQSFWKKSIFEERKGRECYPNFYDLINDKDVRVVYCAQPVTGYFTTMHDYIGLYHYAMATQNQPYFYKGLPLGAFNDAFEQLLVKLASSPHYWKSLGLLDTKTQITKKLEINTLLSEALDNVFVLPYAYSYDLWRWRVAEGKTTPQHYNCEFWKIRTSLQGVEPPVDRTEKDFDPGVTWDMLQGDQFIKYYISEFLKYDMLKGLCTTSGYYDPKKKPNNSLVFCDVSKSKAVGQKFKNTMALGNSRPWLEALEKLSGQKNSGRFWSSGILPTAL